MHLFQRSPLHAVAPLALVSGAFALVACGGGGGSPTSDEEYVASICDTVTEMEDRFFDVASELGEAGSLDEIRELAEELGGIFDDLAGDLDDINPPEDVADAHDRVVQAYRDAADALQSGDIESLDNLGDIDFNPPQSVQDRLADVASEVDACAGQGLFD